MLQYLLETINKRFPEPINYISNNPLLKPNIKIPFIVHNEVQEQIHNEVHNEVQEQIYGEFQEQIQEQTYNFIIEDEVNINEQIIKERYEELELIKKKSFYLNKMSKNINDLVNNSNSQIKNIDRNVEKTLDNTKGALSEIRRSY